MKVKGRLNFILNFYRSKFTLLNYVSSALVSVPISVMSSFLALKYVLPIEMGSWNSVGLANSYVGILGLGVMSGLNRELPFNLGKKRTNVVNGLASTALAYTILLILLVSVIATYIIVNYINDLVLILAAVVVIVHINVGFYTSYLKSTFRSNSEFNVLSRIQWIVAITRIIAIPLIFTGFIGYLIYLTTPMVVETTLAHLYRPIRVRPKFKRFFFVKLIKVGLPLFGATYLIGIVDTIPKLTILESEGVLSVGMFAPCLMLIGVMKQLVNVINSYTTARFTFQYGSTGNIQVIFKQNTLLILGLTATSSLFLFVGYLFLPIFTDIFPKYAQSLPYLQLTLFVLPFMLFQLNGVILVILKKYIYIYLIVGLEFIFLVSCIFLLEALIPDVISRVTWALGISFALLYFFYFSLNYYLVNSPQIKTII